jgi:uncharacterized protein (TIGR02246 family)
MKTLAMFLVLITAARLQQLPHSQVFVQNAETQVTSFGLSCDDRRTWKPVALKGREGQRFECDSETAKMWGHVNTDLAGEPHQEAELSLQNGQRFEIYFDQGLRKWNFRPMGDNGSKGTATNSTTPSDANEDAIRSALAARGSAISARDLPRILELITEDCVFIVPGRPPITGKDSVRTMYERMFEQYGATKIESQIEIQEVQIFGNTAFWRGADEKPDEGNRASAAKFAGYEMGLSRRGADGKWRVARAMVAK